MAVGVRGVVPLIGPERAHLLRDALGHMHIVVRVLVRHRRHLAQLGAAEAQHVLLLLTLRLRNHDDGAVPARVADEREPDAGIARGSFDDDTARPQRAALLSVSDDRERRAVLHRSPRVQELGLAEDRTTRPFRRASQLDERRVADGTGETVTDVHATVTLGDAVQERDTRSPRHGRIPRDGGAGYCGGDVLEARPTIRAEAVAEYARRLD